MKSKITLAFDKCREEKRPALITYTVAGDNTKSISLKILNAISKHADICEVGVGHNCNTGDGKQIQDSTYRAIKNGIKIKDTFSIVNKFKKLNLVNNENITTKLEFCPISAGLSFLDQIRSLDNLNEILFKRSL